MRRVHLTVDHAEMPSCKLAHEMNERDFGSVRNPSKHRLAVKHAPDCDAVETARELAVYPCLYGVRQPAIVQHAISSEHFVCDPGTALIQTRCRACLNHVTKVRVGPNLVVSVAQRLGERPRNFELVRYQHHARVRAPPQNGLTGIEPRKDSALVRFDQPCCG